MTKGLDLISEHSYFFFKKALIVNTSVGKPHNFDGSAPGKSFNAAPAPTLAPNPTLQIRKPTFP
jgi:hypothetical protein